MDFVAESMVLGLLITLGAYGVYCLIPPLREICMRAVWARRRRRKMRLPEKRKSRYSE